MTSFDERGADDLWSKLSRTVRKRFTQLATLDSRKPGQKARVLLAMMDAIDDGGPTSAAAQKLIWADFSDDAVSRQVKDLVQLVEGNNIGAVEYNLVARAGLLIDLQLIPPATYKVVQQMESSHGSASGASELPVCGRFPHETRCACTIPCGRALKEVSLSEIRPGFFIGPIQAAYLDADLRARGVTHVLNLSGTSYHERDFITYCCVDLTDTADGNLRGALPACLRFIHQALGSAGSGSEGGNDGSGCLGGSMNQRGRGGGVLVHCLAGKSRSASVCAAWLMVSECLSAEDAITAVHAAHPRADPNDGFRRALCRFQSEQEQQKRQKQRQPPGS